MLKIAIRAGGRPDHPWGRNRETPEALSRLQPFNSSGTVHCARGPASGRRVAHDDGRSAPRNARLGAAWLATAAGSTGIGRDDRPEPVADSQEP